jgi:hypothetical protein
LPQGMTDPGNSREAASMSPMSKRTPYIEIALTVAVMAFLAVVIAGGFSPRHDETSHVTMQAE